MHSKSLALCLLFLLVLSTTSLVCCSLKLSALDRPVHEMAIIQKINSDSSIRWKATTYEKFEGMTLRQARKYLGTAIILPVNNLPKKKMPKSIKAASHFDAREKWENCVHEIRNQEECGSCWAFSASEAFSDRLCIATNGSVNVVLSPQYMVSCDTTDYGCDGGYLNNAWNFLADTGIPSDECVPYVSGKGVVPQCSKINKKCQDGKSDIKLYKVNKKSIANLDGVEDIQKDIQEQGSIQSGFSVYKDFFSYKKGVYHHVTGSLAGGHAIKVIGWGTTSDGKDTPYWIVANSWGTTWGLNGYFWILRGSDECGIESNAWSGAPQL